MPLSAIAWSCRADSLLRGNLSRTPVGSFLMSSGVNFAISCCVSASMFLPVTTSVSGTLSAPVAVRSPETGACEPV